MAGAGVGRSAEAGAERLPAARRWLLGWGALLVVTAGGASGATQNTTLVVAGDSQWHALDVPGGRATLTALGVPASRERSAVMVDLVRRLHFASALPAPIESAVAALPQEHARLGPSAETVVLPSPLPAETWASAVFERRVPPRQLFAAILADPAARLLFHGLAGLDTTTRAWLGAQPTLLRRLYRDGEAVRAFALFAPALRIDGGQIVVPGGDAAAARWAEILEAPAARPARFVERLFSHNSGRTAGVYFLISAVDEPRQRFLLGDARTNALARLVEGFARCYPGNATATYPFAVRSNDPALLLLEVDLTVAGGLAGPPARAFWQRVFDGEPRAGDPPARVDAPKAGEPIDAAWMVETLCAASSARREAVFTTLLAGHRVFRDGDDADLPEKLDALRARQAYPALFMALEHAGVRRAGTYAAMAGAAARVAQLDAGHTALATARLFQGALALSVQTAAAGTFDAATAAAVFEALAAVPIEQDRYDGRVLTWFEEVWRPSVARAFGAAPAARSAEEAVAWALAGPAAVAPRLVTWEGRDYLFDPVAERRRRLLDTRSRQGGATLDHVIELHRMATVLARRVVAPGDRAALASALAAWPARLRQVTFADEYADQGPDVASAVTAAARALGRLRRPGDRLPASIGPRLLGAADLLLGEVLASWAYATLLSDADDTAAAGMAARHEFGVRATGRRRLEQRWAPGVVEGGAVHGSLLVLQPALAPYLLRRLSVDVLPATPTIGANDLQTFMLTAALSDPRRLTDDDMAQLAAAVSAGTDAILGARFDPPRLEALARAGGLSPWRRAVLPWVQREEPDRLAEQFPLTVRARVGGLPADALHAWGTASSVRGCLCLQLPAARVPEVMLGRAADGIVGGHSADLMLRIAVLLTDLKMPAALATPVLRYAMRDFLDVVTPGHTADVEAFSRQAAALERTAVEDYLGAIAAVGPLRARSAP